MVKQTLPTRALLACGAVAGPVYVTVTMIQALTRDGFDLRQHRFSWLTTGDAYWWHQSSNLLVFRRGSLGAGMGIQHAFPFVFTGAAEVFRQVYVTQAMALPILLTAGALSLVVLRQHRAFLTALWLAQLALVILLAASGADLLRARRFLLVEGMSLVVLLAALRTVGPAWRRSLIGLLLVGNAWALWGSRRSCESPWACRSASRYLASSRRKGSGWSTPPPSPGRRGSRRGPRQASASCSSIARVSDRDFHQPGRDPGAAVRHPRALAVRTLDRRVRAAALSLRVLAASSRRGLPEDRRHARGRTTGRSGRDLPRADGWPPGRAGGAVQIGPRERAGAVLSVRSGAAMTRPPLTAPTLPDLLRAAAREAPAAEAFRYRDERLRYRDWDALADSIAAAFTAHGIGRGDVVALLLPSTPFYLVAYLAAAHVGAVTAGINVRYRRTEIAHRVRRSGAALLVAVGERSGIGHPQIAESG
jgi:hypothetical protein